MLAQVCSRMIGRRPNPINRPKTVRKVCFLCRHNASSRSLSPSCNMCILAHKLRFCSFLYLSCEIIIVSILSRSLKEEKGRNWS